MLTVVIPTLNAEHTLPRTLNSLIQASVRGLVRQVIIVDGGSTDGTGEVADAAGATFLEAPRGRGSQLAAGAEAAKCDWLLFLHADTVLSPGWEDEVYKWFEHVERGRWGGTEVAAAFRFTLEDFSGKARFLEKMVALRCALLRLPYGDQGLIISKRYYRKLGGFKPVPLMEDVDLVRRIGRRRMVFLRSEAVTSPERYVRDGFFRRACRNIALLSLYYLRVPPRLLARLYG